MEADRATAGLDLEDVDRERMAVTLGSAVGGTMVLEDEYVVGLEPRRGVARRPRVRVAVPLPGARAEHAWPARSRSSSAPTGPSVVVSTGCTSGIDAIGYGHQLIQDGEADIVIAGASESPISPISMACFDPIKATSRPQRRPRARLAARSTATATAS